MSDARAKLKAAIAEIDRTEADLAELKKAEASAQYAIEEAEAELESFADLDAEITRFRVEATKRGSSPRKLPDELKAKVNAKRAAEEELEQSKATLEAIEKDLRASRLRLGELQKEKGNSAAAVMWEIGDTLASELLQIAIRQRELATVLNGLGSAIVPGTGRLIGHSDLAAVAIATAGAAANAGPELPGGISFCNAMARRWQTRVDAVMKDPSVEITIPKLVKASDVTVLPCIPFMPTIARPFELRPEE